tara:strand:+ start:26 stop:619 length:594 start_codon:yes stop_codon:yes gene_type:complete
MKKILFALAVLISFSSFGQENKLVNIFIDKYEGISAYNFLNDVRSNSESFKDVFPFLKSSNINSEKLIWNETLALVAQRKAFDMADKNYFDHVDPLGYGINYYINKAGYKLISAFLKNKKDNNFESLGAGYDDGISAIKNLIIDKGVPSLGHRKHLLGMGDFWSSGKDIGIGFVRSKNGSMYNTYLCVIIAKHDWGN